MAKQQYVTIDEQWVPVGGVSAAPGPGTGGGGAGFMGDWDALTAYPAGSIVAHSGASWGTSVDIPAGTFPPGAGGVVPAASNHAADAPAIQIFPGATVLSSPVFSNAGFTTEAGEPAPTSQSDNRSGWLKYAPVSSGAVTFTTDGSQGDTYLTLYRYTGTGAFSFAGLTYIDDDDDGGNDSGTSAITHSCVGGETYYLQLAMYYEADVIDYRFNIIDPQPTTIDPFWEPLPVPEPVPTIMEGTWTWLGASHITDPTEYQGDGMAWKVADRKFAFSLTDANGYDHSISLLSLQRGDVLYTEEGPDWLVADGSRVIVAMHDYIDSDTRLGGVLFDVYENLTEGTDGAPYRVGWSFGQQMLQGMYSYHANYASVGSIGSTPIGTWGSVGGNPDTSSATTTHLWFDGTDRMGVESRYLLASVRKGDLLRLSAQGLYLLARVTGASSNPIESTIVVPVTVLSSMFPTGVPQQLTIISNGGGSTILSGTANPTAGTGAVGDYYFDMSGNTLYGPKNDGYLPAVSVYSAQTPTNTASISSSYVHGARIVCPAGRITGLRYYRVPEDASITAKTLRLYNSIGTQLAFASTSTGNSGAGWKTAMFTTPVATTAGQVIRVSRGISGGYPVIIGYTPILGGLSNGSLTLDQHYEQTGTAWPTTTSTSGFFVDIIFEPAASSVWPVALKSVPPGGTTSQVLAKTDATDYAANWSTPPATGDPAGTAAAAITAHESAANPHPTYLTQAEADALYGGGGLPSRATSSVTTASLAAGASESTTISLAPGYRLLQLTTSRPARVRLYTTAAKRDADAARALGTDPYGNHGLMFEFHTPDNTRMDLSPVVDGYDGDTPPDGTISARIENMDVSAGTVAVTLVWLQIEGV